MNAEGTTVAVREPYPLTSTGHSLDLGEVTLHYLEWGDRAKPPLSCCTAVLPMPVGGITLLRYWHTTFVYSHSTYVGTAIAVG